MSMTANQRLQAAGIKTIRTPEGVFLERNGIRTIRPNVGNCDSVCLALFNVVLTDCVASMQGYRREMERYEPGMSSNPCDAEQMALFVLDAIAEATP